MKKTNAKTAIAPLCAMRSDCPVNFALEVVGDKWTLLVVRDLIFGEKKTYQEFLSSDEQIATNILADRLKRLETMEIITKRISPKDARSAVYALTSKGKSLKPIIEAMGNWSMKYYSGLKHKMD